VKGKKKAELEARDPYRYAELLNLHSTVDNLVQDRMDGFGK
jgi:hypothetical protein